MKPDTVVIDIAAKQFEHLNTEGLRKVLQWTGDELREAQRPGSFTGSGRVLELKTEIAAIKKLLKRRG